MSKNADKSTGWTKKASIATTSSIGNPSPPQQPQSADQDLTQEGLTEPSPSAAAAAAAGQTDTSVGGDSLDFGTTATGGEETLEEEEETNENIATFLASYKI